jgi:hypothetical protein
MRELVDQHVEAEIAGDLDTAVSVYTDDIEHDVVGEPGGPLHGPAAAKEFYEGLQAKLGAQEMEVRREYYGEDFCVIEHDCSGVVTGEFMGIPGNDRRVSFRMLHLWEFKDDAMSRENIWLDGGAIAAQLTAPPESAAPAS